VISALVGAATDLITSVGRAQEPQYLSLSKTAQLATPAWIISVPRRPASPLFASTTERGYHSPMRRASLD
jgi:hypothetical protein